MKNTSNESMIPRESMVVEYVAGTLSERATRQFEQSMQDDDGLKEAVEFERLLRNTAKTVTQSVATSPEQYTASDNFDALLKRVEEYEAFPDHESSASLTSLSDDVSQASKVSQEARVVPFSLRLSKALPIAASFAALGIALASLLKPIGDDLLDPDYVVLSSNSGEASDPVDLKSLSTESRVAKIVLANSLDNAAINNMLAAYQLQLISNLPDQSSLIVLADTAMDSSRLNGIKNDDRVKQISLIKFEN